MKKYLISIFALNFCLTSNSAYSDWKDMGGLFELIPDVEYEQYLQTDARKLRDENVIRVYDRSSDTQIYYKYFGVLSDNDVIATIAGGAGNSSLTFDKISESDFENIGVFNEYIQNNGDKIVKISSYNKETGDIITNYYEFSYDRDTELADTSSRRSIGSNSSIDTVNNNFISITQSKGGGINLNVNGGALEIAGTVRDIVGSFISNMAEYSASGSSIYSVRGGAIYNNGNITNIDAGFIGNVANATGSATVYGGAILNNKNIDNINGVFIGNVAQSATGAAHASAIYNDGKITDITGVFFNNQTKSGNNTNGGVLYNNGTLNQLSGIFVNNENNIAKELKGGVVYNSKTIGNINADFIDNTSNGATLYAGAIYNDSNGNINLISGNFINNTLNATAKAHSSAIYNDGTINVVDGVFAQNNLISQNGNDKSTPGGVLYNDGTIELLTGDFIKNNTSVRKDLHGGVLYNSNKLDNINSNFTNNNIETIDNDGNISGGILYNGKAEFGLNNNHKGTINQIAGDFVENNVMASEIYGGVIYNEQTISNVSSDFIGNSLNANIINGGIIYNTNVLENVIGGEFTDNVNNALDSVSGGVLYNSGTITELSSIFNNNKTVSENGNISGGILYNSDAGKITTLSGMFSNNQVIGGIAGAIYNNGNIEKISGDFINNSVFSQFDTDSALIYGGAIVNMGTINLTASDENVYKFSGNYEQVKYIDAETGTEKVYTFDNAIALGGNAVLNIDLSNNGKYVFDDNIALRHKWNSNGSRRVVDDNDSYTVNITSDGTGIVEFNNKIYDANAFNIENSTVVFGKNENGSATGGFDSDMLNKKVALTMNNATLDIANGYIENIRVSTLTSMENTTNTIRLDVDISNLTADHLVIRDSVTGDINVAFNVIGSGVFDKTVWFADLLDVPGYQFNLAEDTITVGDIEYTLQLAQEYNAFSEHNLYGVTFVSRLLNLHEYVERGNDLAHFSSQIVRKMTNSMEKRVGELQWDNDDKKAHKHKNGLWTRGVYKNSDFKDTNMSQFGMEFGYDYAVYSNASNRFYFGLMGYVSSADATINNEDLSATSYGIGVYGMMLNKNGWFGDIAFREHIVNLDTADKYTASTLNLEIGKQKIFKTDNSKLSYFVKPAFETSFIYVSDISTENYIDIDKNMGIQLNANVIGGPRWKLKDGRIQAYGKLGYTMDFSQDTTLTIYKDEFKQNLGINTYEIGYGVDYRTSKNTTNVYFENTYSIGTDFSELSLNIGLRYIF